MMPYLALIDDQVPQRRYKLRGVFKALGSLVNDFPPWAVVYQQFYRWNEAGCFEAPVKRLEST